MTNGLVAPVVSQLTYNGSLIRANFTYANPDQQEFQIALFAGTSSTPSQTAPSGPLVAQLLNPQMDTTSVWTVKIAATSGSTVGPYSNGLAVIVGPPRDIIVIDDGHTLGVTWSPPAGATVAYGATLSLYNAASNALLDNTTFKSSPGTYRPPGGFDPATSYGLRIAGALESSYGPYSSLIAVIQTMPAFSSLRYSLSGGVASLLANSSTFVPDRLLGLYLYSEGSLYASAIAATPGGVVRLPLQAPLDPAFAYTARLAYTLDGTTRGPLSSALPVVVEPATIAAITYDGATVTASWDHGVGAPPPTGAYVGILDGSGTTVASATRLGTKASLVPSPPLTPNAPYTMTVTVQRGPSLGPVSGALRVLTYEPTPTAVAYDGITIRTTWNATGGSDVTGMRVALLDAGTAVHTQDGGNLQATIAAALSPSGTYDIALRTTGDRTLGPFGASVPVISVVPRVTGAIYAMSGTTSSEAVSWNASAISSAHGLTGYKVQLYENAAPLGSPVIVNGATTDHVTVALSNVLDTSRSHAITVQAVGAKTTGPIGTPSSIITASPQFVSIGYDGASVTARWTPVGQDGITGYRVSVGGTDHVTSLTSITFAYTAGTANPAISVQALGEAATGPTASTTLWSTAVDVKSTGYDGSTLTVGWQATTAPPAYLLEVLEGTSVIASVMTTAVTATLPIVLSASATYGVIVRPASADGIVIGRKSAVAPVIVATPSISHVVYDGSEITGTVTAPSGLALDTVTLQVALFADGIPSGNPVSATGGSFSISARNTAGAGLTVCAAVTGTKSGVTIHAPLSSPVPVVTAMPVIDAALLAADGGAWKIGAAWSLPLGDPAVATFTVVLKQTGTALQTWTVSGRSLSDAAPAFDPLKPLELSVTPVGNYGHGPSSQVATFVPTSIASISAVVTGDRVTASWTDAVGTSFTAHRLRLVQAVGSAWRTIADGEIVDGTTGVVSLPSALLEPDAVYGLTVDAALGTAWTASGSIGPVIVQAPVITTAVSTSPSTVQIAWNAPSSPTGITGYQPVMTWEGGELALDTLPATPRNATLGIPPTVPNDAWITMRAIKGQSIGAIGNAAAFVAGLAQGLAVAYDGTNLRASWNAPGDSRVTAYQVALTASGQAPVVETVYTTSWTHPFTPTAGQTARVAVSLVAGASTGAASPAVDAILHGPSVTKAAFDGAHLTLGWSAVADSAATAYLVEIVSGGVVSTASTSGGTIVTIPFTAGAAVIQIRAIGSSTSGPPSSAFTPITGTPQLTSISFDAASGSLMIGWDAIPGAGSYTVSFRDANHVVLQKTSATNSLTLTALDLPPAGIHDVTVQPFAGTDISGPSSSPLPVVVIPPPNVAIAYDGRTAQVTWEPIRSPAIIGYVATILDGAPVVSQTTVGPAAVIPLAYAASRNYTVVVQALTSAGAGQPSVQAAVFQPGWYPSIATNAASYLTPARTAAMSSYDIVVYLANIFTTYVSSDLPADPPFVFATASAPFSYTLTMPASSAVWTFGADPVRSGVLAAYHSLLDRLVQLKVTPLGWRTVQDAIARAMPQTFAESLYYAYGFAPDNGYIDLKPGMLLRADFESYQYLGPDQPVSAYVDGFVSSSSAVYDIGSYVTAGDQWLTGFDAFLSLVTQAGSTVPTPQSQGSTSSGGGGIVDLYYAQFRKSYVRLVYPPQILGDRSSEARTAFNVAVLAANDYPTLATATQNLRQAQPLPGGVAATYLRGRTMISACIRIWLDGQPLVVPVGTSVGNVLETMARRPPIVIPQSGTPGIPLGGLVLERAIGYAITDPHDATGGYPVSKGVSIRLDWDHGMAYSPATDWLQLPLLPGDRITTRGRK